MKKKPKYPVFNIPLQTKYRTRLSQVLMPFVGTVIEGTQFETLVLGIAGVFKQTVPLEAIQKSLMTLVGKELSKTDAAQTAFRLAGNMPRLRAGDGVPPWFMQHTQEWMPVQIVEIIPGKNFRDDYGFYVHQRVLAGSACPLKIIQYWSSSMCRAISRYLGFSPPWKAGGVTPYSRATELTSMRFLALIDGAETRDNKPGYRERAYPSSAVAWNKKILKARAHIEPPCPHDYQHKCHQCPIGYDQCMAGCHPRTWDWGVCDSCQQEGWIDPGRMSRLCIRCIANL